MPSAYYRKRSEWTIQTLKVTTLTDTELLAVLDVHCRAQWQHDTKTGPQVVCWNTDDLLSIAADKTFQNWQTTFEWYAHLIEPLILHPDYWRNCDSRSLAHR